MNYKRSTQSHEKRPAPTEGICASAEALRKRRITKTYASIYPIHARTASRQARRTHSTTFPNMFFTLLNFCSRKTMRRRRVTPIHPHPQAYTHILALTMTCSIASSPNKKRGKTHESRNSTGCRKTCRKLEQRCVWGLQCCQNANQCCQNANVYYKLASSLHINLHVPVR